MLNESKHINNRHQGKPIPSAPLWMGLSNNIIPELVQVWSRVVQNRAPENINDFMVWSRWSRWSRQFQLIARVRARVRVITSFILTTIFNIIENTWTTWTTCGIIKDLHGPAARTSVDHPDHLEAT